MLHGALSFQFPNGFSPNKYNHNYHIRKFGFQFPNGFSQKEEESRTKAEEDRELSIP